MKLKRKISLLTITFGLMFVGLASAKLPKGIDKVRSVEGISEYHMSNGLQILLFPDPSQETITVNITYHVGSKHESYGETGMAHLLEHLVFKGTPNHKNIPKELTDHGAEPNGSTWTDRTNYFETFTASDENLNWALDLEADRMVNSFIAKKDLGSEMTVVRNEMENGENSPVSVLINRLLAVSYDWHNYGKSTIGARSDVENVDIKNLKDFYKKYYQPDNATLIVAGKINAEETLKLISKYFGKINKPSRKLPKLYTEDKPQDGERQITVRRPGDVQVVAAMYHVPAGADEMFPAVNVLSEILANSSTGRLHKALVKKELAAVTFGFPFQWAEPGVVTFMAQVPKEKDLTAAQNALLKVLEEIKDQPITEQEVQRAKAKLLKDFELSFNSSERVALNISEWLGMGDWRLMFLDRDRLEKVTTAQVQQAAEQFLINSNRNLGLFIPEQKSVRAEGIKRYSKTQIQDMIGDYKGRKAVAQGEDFDPSFDNIEARTKRVNLKNGAKVAYLQKKTRGQSVVVNIDLKIGQLEDLRNLSSIGSLTGKMLQRGTEKHDREALKAAFDELKAAVSVSGSASGVFASITTTKENLPKVLKLLDEVLKIPAFSQQELDVLKQQIIVGLEQQRQQPQSLVFSNLSRHMQNYEASHPRYRMSIDEQIAATQKVTTEDLKKFHKKFYGANNANISIVGDFDPETVLEQLEQSLGNWNSKSDYQRIAASYYKPEAVNRLIDTPDKAGAAFGAMLNLSLNDEDPDFPALVMANEMLGGGFISSRLANRLRQKDGLSYGAGSSLGISSYDKTGRMVIYAICAPENLKKVEQGFKEELQKAIKDGFTQQELDDARKGLLQGYRVDRAKDRRLAGILSSNLDLNRSQEWDKKYEQAIQDLTISEVNAAFRKHIKLDDFSIIKAGDNQKAKIN